MPRQATKTIGPPLRGRRWRWQRRIAVLLFAGILLTVISSWIAQWHGFVTSREVRWVQGPITIFTRWAGSPGAYYDSGDGVRLYNHDFTYATPNNPAPQHTATRPEEIPWLLTFHDLGGSSRWSATRHYWDDYAPIEGYSELEERVHIKPTRGHYFSVQEKTAYWGTNRLPAWHAQARTFVPNQVLHANLDPTDRFESEPFLDQTTGWVAASAFRPVPGHSDIDSSIPVERWSAQRAGWPMHAMMTEQYAIGPRPPIERVQDMPFISLRHSLRGGLILHHLAQHPMLHPLGHHSLPLVPLWPGFAVNTAFYATCVATLWLAAANTRHALGTKRRRRKRGQCEACGYDLTGLDQCPECGQNRITT